MMEPEKSQVQMEQIVEAKAIVSNKFPCSATLILTSKIFETFTFYGMRAVLVLYLTQSQGYDNNTATVIFHSFSMVSFMSSVIGAIISDSWLGKFSTIAYISIVYAIGVVLMSVASISVLEMPQREITLLALFMVGMGSGGIKPCYQAIGGDQFRLPEQKGYMLLFFSLFVIVVHGGTMVSTAVTPILRQDYKCFGADDCYPLAFGISVIMMGLMLVIFLSGKRLYVITAPAGNMVGLVAKCIATAIVERMKEPKTNKRLAHWLDYADEKYGKSLVADTKSVLGILKLFLPLPLYWALYELQGSRWTIQATQMDGDIGIYRIKPDQMQLLGPLAIIVFIPTFQYLVYPLLARIGIARPLQKLSIGGMTIGVAVLISGLIELKIQATHARLPEPGQCHLRIYNGANCNYTVRLEHNDPLELAAMDTLMLDIIVNDFEANINYSLTSSGPSNECFPLLTGQLLVGSQQSISQHISSDGLRQFEDDPRKSRSGDPKIRILFSDSKTITFIDRQTMVQMLESRSDSLEPIQLPPGEYDVRVDGTTAALVTLRPGSVSSLLIRAVSETRFDYRLVEITPANSVHMLWQLPQYIVLATGATMYGVVGLVFTYSEGPQSMKSVMQATWLLTVAFGHVIDIVIVGANFFQSQANEFFFFSGLMFLDMVVFMVLAKRYKSSSPTSNTRS